MALSGNVVECEGNQDTSFYSRVSGYIYSGKPPKLIDASKFSHTTASTTKNTSETITKTTSTSKTTTITTSTKQPEATTELTERSHNEGSRAPALTENFDFGCKPTGNTSPETKMYGQHANTEVNEPTIDSSQGPRIFLAQKVPQACCQ